MDKMDDLAPISVSTGGLNEARWKTGDLYVYRHRIRCPSCHAWWRLETAAPRGAIDPKPDPAKILGGLLCGACSARRRAFAITVDGAGKSRAKRFWGDADDKRLYGICLNPRGVVVEISRGDLWDRVTPLVDERADREREILDVDGRRCPGMSAARLSRLGLDWIASGEVGG